MTNDGNPLETMARVGYGARGLVYTLVGGLALLAAFGSGGQTGGSRSALRTLIDQPFGRIILGAVALGLAFFAAWRIVEALTDADHQGSSGKALGIRGAHFISGLIYAGLAFSTLGLALGWGSGGGGEDQAARDWTAWLLDKPFGQWLVGLVGAAIAGTGLAFLRKGWRADISRHLALPSEARQWVVPLGRAGYAGRGIVFVLIGGFLILAGIHGNSSEVQGLGGALRTLEGQPYGWVLLALTAAGLAAFGLFGLAQAFYRRIDAPDPMKAGAAMAQQIRAL